MAPLSGYTDLALRRACRRHGAFYAFTPLVEAGAVVYGNPRTDTLLLRGDDEPWLGVQLLGSSCDRLAKAVRIVGELPFDLVDLNMGCPVRKVTKRGAGAALCTDPELAARCIDALVDHTSRPVSAKIRILSRTDPAPTVSLAERLVASGIAALTIHGRVVADVYSGPCQTDILQAVREAVPIPVIANGGIMNAVDASRIRQETGCSRIMLARGAVGNPWIFRALANPAYRGPSHQDVCDEIHHHVSGMVALHGEHRGMRHARKIIAAYLCGRGYRRAKRKQATALSTFAEFDRFLSEIRQEGPTPAYLEQQTSAAHT